VEDAKVVYFGASIGAIDMSLFAILLFVGTMVLSLWATMRVRQVYGKFSQLPASSGLTGAETAATILRQEGISNVEIVEHDEALGDHYSTRVRSSHTAQASLCTAALADGLRRSDDIWQSDRALAAVAGDVHRFHQHRCGLDPCRECFGAS